MVAISNERMINPKHTRSVWGNMRKAGLAQNLDAWVAFD